MVLVSWGVKLALIKKRPPLLERNPLGNISCRTELISHGPEVAKIGPAAEFGNV